MKYLALIFHRAISPIVTTEIRGQAIVSVSTVFRKYFVFSGRASRREFGYYTYFFILFVFVSAFIDELVRPFLGQIVSNVFTIMGLVSVGAYISLYVRRLHDIDRSGWTIIRSLIFGVIGLFAVPFEDGTIGPNRYGQPPTHPSTPRTQKTKPPVKIKAAKKQPRPEVTNTPSASPTVRRRR